MRKRGLCGQTVTVYHPVPMKKRVDRYVLRDVFCQIGSREVPDAAGAKSGAAMLLVVPETDATRYSVDYKLAAGDRVMLGEGPEVEWAAWPSFVPAEVDGLGAITYVLPLYLRGALHHVEAGAWWSAGGAGGLPICGCGRELSRRKYSTSTSKNSRDSYARHFVITKNV